MDSSSQWKRKGGGAPALSNYWCLGNHFKILIKGQTISAREVDIDQVIVGGVDGKLVEIIRAANFGWTTKLRSFSSSV